MMLYQTGQIQCPNGDTSGNQVYDTIVSPGRGNYSTQYKFPQFCPDGNLVSSDRVMTFENNVSGPAICHKNYVKNDTLTGFGKAEIKWSGFEEYDIHYRYKIEISNNGDKFSKVSLRSDLGGHGYKFIYAAEGNKKWGRFFRIKPGYSNGYTLAGEIILVKLKNSDEPKINIYPNPINYVVGIKFVNIFTGKFLIQISNTQGQTVFSKEVQIYGERFRFIATLQGGMYWLRLIEVTSHLSCVNQLLIK